MKYFLKILIVFTIIGTFGNKTFSQTTNDSIPNLKDKLFFGGDFGLSFGAVTYIELSPAIGYRLTDKLSAGVGVIYKYISSKNYYSTYSFSTSIYGGKMFANYMVTNNFFPHVEFEVLSLEHKYFDFLGNYPDDGRYLYESLFVGAGYRYPIGKNSYITTVLLYNINHSSNSFYPSPYVWRLGFNF